MKSSSAGPDFVSDLALQRRRSTPRLARSARRRCAGSVSIGARARRTAAAPRAEPASGSDGMKSPRSRIVCSASPISGSDLPEHPSRPARLAGDARICGDVDEQPPARFVHRPRRRQLPHREPERLHRVGHHLLMADGDVDVILLVARLGNRKQRRDRPALDDLEIVVDETPFDVLRAAEVRFDPAAELREPHDLRIRQRGLLLPLRRRSPARASRLPATRSMASCLVAIVFATISPSRTL